MQIYYYIRVVFCLGYKYIRVGYFFVLDQRRCMDYIEKENMKVIVCFFVYKVYINKIL